VRKSEEGDKAKGDPKMIGPWRIGRTIGKGSSGRVKIAKHGQTGQFAAVKIVPKHVLMNSRLSLGEAGAKVRDRSEPPPHSLCALSRLMARRVWNRPTR
jgi:serine/threonine protein kinase